MAVDTAAANGEVFVRQLRDCSYADADNQPAGRWAVQLIIAADGGRDIPFPTLTMEESAVDLGHISRCPQLPRGVSEEDIVRSD